MRSEVVANIIGGVAVALLTTIATILFRTFRLFRRFMAEHIWLITTTLWTRDKVIRVMHHMNLPIEDVPPADLPRRLLWRI